MVQVGDRYWLQWEAGMALIQGLASLVLVMLGGKTRDFYLYIPMASSVVFPKEI